ncbi:rCG44121 [Rattus norvegicus]|uniref:RCG44121 n=1 Tax=Rattus norvegicus TaxID=10116 RepID=A6J7K7_RAT|nr:rCG44121 [Rattus norvegicus]
MGRSVETSILPVMLIRKQCVTEVKWKYKSVFIPGLCSSLDT